MGELDETDFLEGLPPLVRASRTGDLDEVCSLLPRAFHLLEADSDGWSALHAAASRNHTEIIRVLLDAGCPVDVMDDSGFTPLLNAAGPGSTETISRLLLLEPTLTSESPCYRRHCYVQPTMEMLKLQGS